jgi:hypothetical protein
MSFDPEIDDLRAEIAALRARLEVAEPATATRRHLLRLAGAATVGAAAAIATRPGISFAAALETGDINLVAAPTMLQVNGDDLAHGFAVADNGLIDAQGVTGSALVGQARGLAFETGVTGYGSGTAATGVRGSALGENTVGVRARSDGDGAVGLVARATGRAAVGAVFTADRYGMETSGGVGALRLTGTRQGDPSLRADPVDGGVIDVDTGNTLWFCTAAGTPGTWRRLAGADTAGAFTAVDPVRVYDSRLPAPTPGLLATGADRVVSVADGRDTNGSVSAADVVPLGATAIAFNITITETSDSGFLSVAPGNAFTSPSSSINWTSAGQTLANGLIVKIHTDRTVKVFCGGGGSTHFLIDVSGFWR